MDEQRILAMTSYVEAGFVLTPLNGKHPLLPRWQEALYELEIDYEKFYAPIQLKDGGFITPDNFGVVLQEDDFVIDVDPRNFDPSDKPHVRLFKDFGIIKEQCFVVQTGSGGLHLYFKKEPGIHVKTKHSEYNGVEFKTRGSQVVGFSCIHPETKKQYIRRLGDLRAIPQCPAPLLEMLRSSARRKHTSAKESRTVYDDSDASQRRFVEYLREAPIAIEGQGGDATTFRVACEGRNYGLSPETTYALLEEHYNPRCLPPWTTDDLHGKVENAYAYAQGEVGEKTPDKDFKAVETTEIQKEFKIAWDRTSSNGLKKTIRNIINWFFIEKTGLQDTLAFDEFQSQVMVMKDLPWRAKEDGAQWTDDDSKELRFYLNHKFRVDTTTALIDEAVHVVSKRKPIHPIRDYLNSIKWDGKKRLDNWLSDYAGVTPSDYSREVGAKLLLTAVARIFNPGCQVDNVVILEGAQGVGKSSLVKALGEDYYVDIIIDPHNRDTVDAMRGAWFVEFSEMEVTRRSDVQALKAFISRRTDRVRLAYGKRSVNYPRQCIFVGTINPSVTGEYLPDETGNRRWWPVVVGKVKLDSIKKDRDQLFAEAVHRFLKGEAIFTEDKHVLKLAMEEQEKRRFHDPWGEVIADFLETNELAKEHNFTTLKEVWLFAIKGSEGQMNRVQEHRIAQSLRDLGWERVLRRHPITKNVVRAFVKGGAPKEEEDIFS